MSLKKGDYSMNNCSRSLYSILLCAALGCAGGNIDLSGSTTPGVSADKKDNLKVTQPFRRAHLKHADFTNTMLHGEDFSSADLSGGNFTGADLTMTDFSWSDLTGAIMVKADLTVTRFSPTRLSGGLTSAIQTWITSTLREPI